MLRNLNIKHGERQRKQNTDRRTEGNSHPSGYQDRRRDPRRRSRSPIRDRVRYQKARPPVREPRWHSRSPIRERRRYQKARPAGREPRWHSRSPIRERRRYQHKSAVGNSYLSKKALDIELSKAETLKEIKKLLSDYSKARFEPDFHTQCKLDICLSAISNPKELIKILYWRNDSKNPYSKIFQNGIHAYTNALKHADYEAFVFIMEMMKKDEIKPNRATRCAIGTCLENMTNGQEAIKILKWLMSYDNQPPKELYPEVPMYTSALKHADYEVFVAIMAMMFNRGIEPNVRTRYAIGACIENQTSAQEAIKILQWLHNRHTGVLYPEVSMYNSALKHADYEAFVSIMAMMVPYPIKPDVQTRYAIGTCLENLTSAEDIIEILQWLNSKENQYSKVLYPEVSTYTSALKHADGRAFVSIMKMMVESSIKPNDRTRYAIDTCFENLTSAEDIIEILQWLNSEENSYFNVLYPELSTYNSALKHADSKAFVRIMTMMDEDKIQPDIQTRYAISTCFENITSAEDIIEILQWLNCETSLYFNVLQPEVSTYNSALKHADSKAFVRIMTMMGEDRIQPDIQTRYAISTCFENLTSAEDIIEILQWLNSEENSYFNVLYPELSIYNSALKHADSKAFVRIMTMMAADSVQPDIQTNYAVGACLENLTNAQDAIDILQWLKNPGDPCFQVLYPERVMYTSALKHADYKAFIHIMDMMVADKIEPNIQTRYAIGACIENLASAEQAIEILRWLKRSNNPFLNVLYPEVLMYTSALKHADYKAFIDIMDMMVADKIEPNIQTRYAIGACIENLASAEQAIEIVRWLKRSNNPFLNVLYPDIVMYTSALKHADYDKFIAITKLMAEEGIYPNEATRYAIRACLENLTTAQDAIKILKWLEDEKNGWKSFFTEDMSIYAKLIEKADANSLWLILQRLNSSGLIRDISSNNFISLQSSSDHTNNGYILHQAINKCLKGQVSGHMALEILENLVFENLPVSDIFDLRRVNITSVLENYSEVEISRLFALIEDHKLTLNNKFFIPLGQWILKQNMATMLASVIECINNYVVANELGAEPELKLQQFICINQVIQRASDIGEIELAGNLFNQNKKIIIDYLSTNGSIKDIAAKAKMTVDLHGCSHVVAVYLIESFVNGGENYKNPAPKKINVITGIGRHSKATTLRDRGLFAMKNTIKQANVSGYEIKEYKNNPGMLCLRSKLNNA